MKTEEKVNVQITEEPDIKEDVVKDINISLNTLESGDATVVTDVLNICLKALIIDTDKQVHIKISMAEYPEIVLYENMEFRGAQYLPLAISTIAGTGDRFNFAPEEWYLNDRLMIEIKGQFQTNVNVKIRHKWGYKMVRENRIKEYNYDIPTHSAGSAYISDYVINGEILEIISDAAVVGSLALRTENLTTREIWRLNASSGANPIVSYPTHFDQSTTGSIAGAGTSKFVVNDKLSLAVGSSIAATNISVSVRYR